MEEINHDLSSDFLENEKFDFDLAFSPMKGQHISKPEEGADDEEVFFGPVGFTEQCVATRTKVLQEESNIKPLSPLTGEQVVEIFQEATKVALRLEKLTSKDSSISNSSSSSKSSSLSNSILKLSSSSESPSWLTGKLSCGSLEGTNFPLLELDFNKENIHPFNAKEENLCSVGKTKQQSPAMLWKNIGLNISGKIEQNYDLLDVNQNGFEQEQQELDTLKGQMKMSENDKTDLNDVICNENVQPTSIEGNLHFTQSEQQVPAMLEKIRISGKINECEQNDIEKELKKEPNKEKVEEMKSCKIPMAKARALNLPRPGLRSSKLPKSKNTEKSQSAFSSPIRRAGASKKRADVKNDPVKNPRKENSQNVEKLGASQSANKLQKSIPTSLPQDAWKINKRPAKTLAKRNIFTSSESLDKLGTKECKSKLPVSQQSKIPGPRPRRRRSSSLSSLDSSQSSASSQTSQDDNPSQLTRPSTKIPTTKASLAASFGLTQRSKLQDTTADKRPQPLKALPRQGFSSSTKNSKTDTKIANPMPPPSTEQHLKDDKIPVAATPRSSSSLPVAKRRSSFKSSLSSTSSREGSPPKYITPSKSGKITEPTSSTTKRRSAIPTPGRNAPSSASRRVLRSSGDDSILLSLSPASKPKKNQVNTRQTNRKLIPDDEPHSVKSSQTVDDLLDCDDSNPIFEDVIPMQPKPVAQPDLIDLSGL